MLEVEGVCRQEKALAALIHPSLTQLVEDGEEQLSKGSRCPHMALGLWYPFGALRPPPIHGVASSTEIVHSQLMDDTPAADPPQEEWVATPTQVQAFVCSLLAARVVVK